MTTDGVRLGDLLTGAGLLQASDLREAMLISKQQSLPVGRVLIMSGYLTEQNLQAAVQAQSLLKDGLIEFELVIKALTMVGAEDITLEEAFKRLKWNQQTDAVTNKLGELLLAAEIVPIDALNAALLQCQSIGLPLGRVLIANGALTEQMLAATLNAQVFIRDKKLTRDQAIQGLKSAKERQIPIEQYLAESGAMQLPTAETVRLGELFQLAGIIDEPNLMGAVEVGLLNEQPLGQVLLNSSVITQEILDAALDLQAMVGAGAIKKDEAVKYLGVVKNKKVTVGEAIALSQKKPSKKAAAATAAVEEPQFVIEPLPFYQFLQLSGIITSKQIEEAIRVGSKDTQIMAKMLMLAGIMQQPLLDAAQKCNDLITSGVLNHEQAMIAVKSCERNNFSLEEAFNELGWNTAPLRANPDVPDALLDIQAPAPKHDYVTETTKQIEPAVPQEAGANADIAASEPASSLAEAAAPAASFGPPVPPPSASKTHVLPTIHPEPAVAQVEQAVSPAAQAPAQADAASVAEPAQPSMTDTADTLTPLTPPGEVAASNASLWGPESAQPAANPIPSAEPAAPAPMANPFGPPPSAIGQSSSPWGQPPSSGAEASAAEAPAAQAPATSSLFGATTNPFESPEPAASPFSEPAAMSAAPIAQDLSPASEPAPAVMQPPHAEPHSVPFSSATSNSTAASSPEPTTLAEFGAALSAVSFGEPAAAEQPASAAAIPQPAQAAAIPVEAPAPAEAPVSAATAVDPDDGWKTLSHDEWMPSGSEPAAPGSDGAAPADPWQSGGQAAQQGDAWSGGQAQQFGQPAQADWAGQSVTSQPAAAAQSDWSPPEPAPQQPAAHSNWSQATPQANPPVAQPIPNSASPQPAQADWSAAPSTPLNDWTGSSSSANPAAAADWSAAPAAGADWSTPQASSSSGSDWSAVPAADWGTSSAPATAQNTWSTEPAQGQAAPAASSPQPAQAAPQQPLAAQAPQNPTSEWQPPAPAAGDSPWAGPSVTAPTAAPQQGEWQPPQSSQQPLPQAPQPAAAPAFQAPPNSPMPGWQSSSSANLDQWQPPAPAQGGPSSAAQMFQEAAQSLAASTDANPSMQQPAAAPAAEQSSSQLDLFGEDDSDQSDKPKKRLSDLMPKFGPKI